MIMYTNTLCRVSVHRLLLSPLMVFLCVKLKNRLLGLGADDTKIFSVVQNEKGHLFI